MPPEEQDPLKRLQQRLYANEAPRAMPSQSLRPQQPSAPLEPWTVEPQATPEIPKKRISWAVWFLGGSLIFFLIAIGVTFLFLAHGGRAVSNENLSIVTQGPTTIASGTTVPVVITIQNHNPSDLTNAKLSLSFPDGTRSSDDVTQPLVRYEGDLGTVIAGGTTSRTIQAVLFGTVNQTVTIPVTITYGTNNSNVSFTKTENYTFTITSSPLSISVESAPSASSGQSLTIAVLVRSNATTPLQNVAVAAQYPFGFTATNTSAASSTGSVYQLGTIAPGEEKRFTVSGIVTGSDAAQQDFQFMAGTLRDAGSNMLGVAYASADSKVTLQKPFLATTLTLNNQTKDPLIINAGQEVSGTLSWSNTLSAAITNGQISIKLSGAALDPTTVRVTNGYYNSSANTLIFNAQTESSLLNLNPGDTGNGSFTFSTKQPAQLSASTNPTAQLAVSVSGRVNGNLIELTNSLTKQVQLSSSLGLTSKILHSTGAFPNSGPWPPRVGQPTTYTVQLSIANTVNAVAGAVVTAILPPYVTYTGQVSPTDGTITYDSVSHTVTWKAGAITAGAGIGSAAPTASFQIAFTPSSTQVGQSPVLVESQELTGQDRVTQNKIDTTADALTTQAPNDPAYKVSFGNVTN